MWIYRQSTGELISPEGEVIGIGYSGYGAGKNNPLLQDMANLGPLPEGIWHIGPAENNPVLGPVAMKLTPDETTDTFGRSGFWVHGDSRSHPGLASHGCPVMDHDARVALSLSPDKLLYVEPGARSDSDQSPQ